MVMYHLILYVFALTIGLDTHSGVLFGWGWFGLIGVFHECCHDAFFSNTRANDNWRIRKLADTTMDQTFVGYGRWMHKHNTQTDSDVKKFAPGDAIAVLHVAIVYLHGVRLWATALLTVYIITTVCKLHFVYVNNISALSLFYFFDRFAYF